MIKVPDLRSVLALITVGALIVQQAFPGTRYYVIAAAVLAAVATHAAAPDSSAPAPATPPGRVPPPSSPAPAAPGPSPMAEPRSYVAPPPGRRLGP